MGIYPWFFGSEGPVGKLTEPLPEKPQAAYSYSQPSCSDIQHGLREPRLEKPQTAYSYSQPSCNASQHGLQEPRLGKVPFAHQIGKPCLTSQGPNRPRPTKASTTNSIDQACQNSRLSEEPAWALHLRQFD